MGYSKIPVLTRGMELEEPRTLVEKAYILLREDLIKGRYLPGTRLRVEHMKDDYDVGAGTLREALSLLVSDALVVSEGQRGFWVAPISLADLQDLTRTRTMLETEALRLSIRQGDDEWEANLVAAFHRLTRIEEKKEGALDTWAQEWERRNKEFHEALIAACDSQWLRYLLNILFRQSERYRRLALTKAIDVKRDVHAEHNKLFEAALQRDEQRALALLANHIQATCDTICRSAPEGIFGGQPQGKAPTALQTLAR